MTIRDQNGRVVRKDIKKHPEGGWEVNVWFGGFNGFATDITRLVYSTREGARQADISDYGNDPDWVGYA